MSSPSSLMRITVLISGSGTNLQAILDACGSSRLPNAQVTYVLSSRSTAYGLTRARDAGVPTSVCALKTFTNRDPATGRVEYDQEVARRVVASRPDLVVLAGWMHILSPEFLAILDGSAPLPDPRPTPSAAATEDASQSGGSPTHLPIPIINLHPALPGAFDGARAIERAHEAFQRGEISRTGVMVHRVVAEVDAGEPLVVREVECREGESLEALEERMHEVSRGTGLDGVSYLPCDGTPIDRVGQEGNWRSFRRRRQDCWAIAVVYSRR